MGRQYAKSYRRARLLLHLSPISMARCSRPTHCGKIAGRTAFKSEVAKRGALDVAGLPWRADVVEYLRSERLQGLVLSREAAREILAASADVGGSFLTVVKVMGDRLLRACCRSRKGNNLLYLPSAFWQN
jgi:hypothetical protein